MDNKKEDEIESKRLERFSSIFLAHISIKTIFKSLFKCVANTLFYTVAYLCGAAEVLWFYFKRRFLGHRVPNYSVVEGDYLHRGGLPSDAGLDELVKKGIKTIINLRIGNFSKKVIEEYHEDEVRIIHLPFSPYEPQDEIMIDFLKILLNPSRRPAFVHCFHGMDRTGAVCAIYRIIVQNWDKESAILEMKKRGLHWWQKNMIDYIRNLDVDTIRQKAGIEV